MLRFGSMPIQHTVPGQVPGRFRERARLQTCLPGVALPGGRMGLLHALASGAIVARLAAGFGHARLVPARGLGDRLGDIPLGGLAVSAPVRIHWDRFAIPFIEADSEHDAALALGVVHAHLRLGQMEIMRRLAQGRLAEMLGPAAVEADHGLRILGFGNSVPAIMAAMPARTRQWCEAFVAGITHYALNTPRLPPEFAMLGLRREPWSVADVLGVGRLAAADCNWFVLFNLLRLRGRADWPLLWRGIADHEGAAFRPLMEQANALADLATRASRAGSNAIAVAGHRSNSGAALMAADPHLQIQLPNVWIAGGVKSPGLHATGLMIPGLPFIAIGRNPQVAWSGTAMQSASSDLFDAQGLPAEECSQTIRSRLGPTTRRIVRRTPLGPLVSDARLLGARQPLALRWVGHDPSDELTGWLGMARATDWQGFAASADMLSVPGQNLLYADAKGRVGKLMAARLPRRGAEPPEDVVLATGQSAHWDSFVTARDLPHMVDPAGGVLASANEQPRHGGVRVGLFFSSHDRFLRLHRLAQGQERLGLDDLARFQRDVFSETALDMKAWLVRRLGLHALARTLDNWDGCYQAHSRGAAAFELLVGHLHNFAHGDAGQDAYWGSWNPTQLMRRRLAEADPVRLEAALAKAANHVRRQLRDGLVWGDIHRLRLEHPLVALLGPLARFADLPTGGGNETLMKTAHGLASGRHGVRFGATARFLADMTDPDRNNVVLLGGQDGWLGSRNFLDQLPLWREGRAIPLPLRPETARARALHTTVLRP
jgi:penicillin amidase